VSNTLTALPLTQERFAPFGDVLEALADNKQAMNSARFERFCDLADVDVGSDSGGRTSISIARSRSATELPYRVDMLERHPDGSQAFMPLANFQFVVVVAPAGESVDMQELAAFVSNGRQGINYHKGVWHMPMIAMQEGQEFLIIDRAGDSDNCDEYFPGKTIMVDI
jgi:ureidoglycolate lyase